MTGEPAKTPRELRRFGLTAAAALALAASLLYWRGKPFWPIPAGFSGFILLAALLAPRALRPAERAGRAAVKILTAALTAVVLTLAFYAVLTPIGLCLRLLGKSPLSTRPDGRRSSYWERVSADSEYARPDRPY